MSLIKLLAFIRRDFKIAVSYKFSTFLQFGIILLHICAFYFLSRLFEGKVVSHLEPYGGDYFSFVLIGFAVSDYLAVSLHSFSQSIRESQLMGTLEAIMGTQTSLPTIIISSALYPFIFTSLRVVVYLLLGILLFGLNWKWSNLFASLPILFLSIISFSSIGVFSASFIMIFKKGDPIAVLFSAVSWLLGGTLYPVSVLPSWLERLSNLIPLTHSLEAMRLVLLQGYSVGEIWQNLLALLLFATITLPLSFALFTYAVKITRINGTLAQF